MQNKERTQNEILDYLRSISWLADGDAEQILNGILPIIYPDPYLNKKCCVCGENAAGKHMSIVGQIPFYVCETHHKETFSSMGYDFDLGMQRMGLMNRENKWVDFVSNPEIK